MSNAPPSYTSDQSLADAFDGPWIEPVRMPDPENPGKLKPRDISFARPDMDYWDSWAAQLREKRRTQNLAELNKLPGLDPITRSRAVAEINARDVQIYTVLDMQYIPAGITKILNDALARAGMSKDADRKEVLKRIAPQRQQVIASILCSEPQSTIESLRESAKALAVKLGYSPSEVIGWDDQALIDFATRYQPPPPPTSEAEEDPTQNPTEPGEGKPGTGSTGEPETPA